MGDLVSDAQNNTMLPNLIFPDFVWSGMSPVKCREYNVVSHMDVCRPI